MSSTRPFATASNPLPLRCPRARKSPIASQLERLGVDVVEAGFPAASDGEWAGVHAVAGALQGPIVAAMARAIEGDVVAAASALEPARRSRVHIVLATSDVHLERKLQMTQAEIIERTRDIVTFASTRFTEVEFCCEDASRTEAAFVVQVCRAAVDAGATILNIPDTVGYAVPTEYAALIGHVVTACPGCRRRRPLPRRPRPGNRKHARSGRCRSESGRMHDQRDRRASRQRGARGGRCRAGAASRHTPGHDRRRPRAARANVYARLTPHRRARGSPQGRRRPERPRIERLTQSTSP